jgi:hypothetical protein
MLLPKLPSGGDVASPKLRLLDMALGFGLNRNGPVKPNPVALGIPAPYGLSADGGGEPKPAPPYGPICAEANDVPPARMAASTKLSDLFIMCSLRHAGWLGAPL